MLDKRRAIGYHSKRLQDTMTERSIRAVRLREGTVGASSCRNAEKVAPERAD